MSETPSFNEVLDAIESLPDEQQADLVDVVRRRLAERGRERIVADAAEARAEMADGKLRPASVKQIMREMEE